MLEVGFKNINAIVTDGAGNMRKAWNILSNDPELSSNGVDCIWCAEHIANLIAKDAARLISSFLCCHAACFVPHLSATVLVKSHATLITRQ